MVWKTRFLNLECALGHASPEFSNQDSVTWEGREGLSGGGLSGGEGVGRKGLSKAEVEGRIKRGRVGEGGFLRRCRGRRLPEGGWERRFTRRIGEGVT